MKKAILSSKKLSKSFEQNSETVLNGIDIEIYEGDFTIIMGASGSGKSTLLYALSGMDEITSGKVIYKDEEISSYSEKQMAKLRSNEFGFVFQQTHLVSNLTLFENVAVAGYLNKNRTENAVKERAEQLLSEMKVEKARDRLPQNVSGGEAQRAAIARAMIHEPGLIFADEPTGALNRRNSEQVLDLLSSLNEKGQSILMVTHDLRAAIRGTRLLYLEDGSIIDELIMPRFLETSIEQREAKINEWLATVGW